MTGIRHIRVNWFPFAGFGPTRDFRSLLRMGSNTYKLDARTGKKVRMRTIFYNFFSLKVSLTRHQLFARDERVFVTA